MSLARRALPPENFVCARIFDAGRTAGSRSVFRWAMDGQNVDLAARIASNVGDMGRFSLREEAANWASEVVDAARRTGPVGEPIPPIAG